MSETTAGPEILTHPRIPVEHLPIRLAADARRSIMLPFNALGVGTVESIYSSVVQLDEEEADRIFGSFFLTFGRRYADLEDKLEEGCRTALALLPPDARLSGTRRMVFGSYFTMEYSIEAAALFNPSIVPHPDQDGAPDGGVKIVMSLRAVGEGHISSTVFRTGVLGPGARISLDPESGVSMSPRISLDSLYHKDLLRRSISVIGATLPDAAEAVFSRLPETFTHDQLVSAISYARKESGNSFQLQAAVSSLEWIVRANYSLRLPEGGAVSDVILFPKSESESKGIEDMRLVRFTDDDGGTSYYGTYTGFNGATVLPMIARTPDFKSFTMHTLNGACALNKGMALFPRRIGGHYAMCSRIDGRNLYIMYSDYETFWETASLLAEPKYTWEMRLIGNCGSPLETPHGWLLLTHGVGPMRRYSIGAFLLDRDDPTRIIGRLKDPLITPAEQGVQGYVPNVVYSCGSLIHDDRLFLPYAVSDSFSRVAAIPLDALVREIIDNGP